MLEIFTPFLIYLIAPGFSGNEIKFDLAVELTRITFPFLLFVTLSSFFSGILNSNNKFAAAAAAPIILNIILIISILISYYYNLNIAKQLSYGVTTGRDHSINFFNLLYIENFINQILRFKFKISKKSKIFF